VRGELYMRQNETDLTRTALSRVYTFRRRATLKSIQCRYASSRYIARFPALRHNWFFQLHFHFSNQLITGLSITLTVSTTATLTFHNLTNSSLVRSQLSPKFYENPSIIFRVIVQKANKQTNRQTDKGPLKQYQWRR